MRAMPIVEADPAAPPAVPGEPPLAALVRGEQIRAQYAGMPGAFVSSALCATVLAVTLVHRLTTLTLAGWLLCAYGNSALRGLLWYRFWQVSPAPAALPRWQRRLSLSALLAGLIWGTGGLLLHVPGSFTQQIFVLLVMIGMALTALLVASGSVPAFVMFVAPLLILSAVPFLMGGDGTEVLIGVATLLLLPVMIHLGQRLARDLTHTIQTRLSHGRLLEQLRLQKQAAEEASAAKSRFLAMASHDLRQPLHALNLFVQALQERRLPGPERELVDNVRRSVDAMDELFDALLDISRLDAGSVRGRLATFPLEEVFERLRFEFGTVARQKDLRFKVPKTGVYVRSDPELLGQILRNLLGNALRYTERGGVLMGCRRDAGGGVRIEVWDTGCGIPPEQHARVFEEFTQLGNPVRDRRKGLGLGLAIVERLSRVLSHSVTLRSRVGSGSMFAVTLPRGGREDHVPRVSPDMTRAFDLSGLTVLLIHEELPVRAGLERLLSKWGCQVIAAGSGAEAIDRLAARPAYSPTDIIIVDYPLREQAAGVTVLQQLQGEIGAKMPALVVTAGSAQERHECEEGGIPVLTKPVNPARLRTLLAHIAGRSARERSARRAAG